jgi:putative cell wall-binding protein
MLLPHGDEHGPDPDSEEALGIRGGTDPLLVPPSTGIQVRVRTQTGQPPAGARVDLVNPGVSRADAVVGRLTPGAASARPPLPTIYTRADWGADETLRESTVDYGEVNAGFVHHTVNANDYTADEVPGIIRAIYAFHVTSRGYRDIGYNFLVDKYGRVWEGRHGGIEQPVVGAHTLGYNSVAFAMSAIGTYTGTAPTSAMITAYQGLFAWKLSNHGVSALGRATLNGTAFDAVSGHRDANATECPGNALYAQIPTIRTGAAALQSASPIRLAGPDRFGTAAAVAREVYPSASSVVVVDGRDAHLVDGLVAGPLSGATRAPILLSWGSVLPAASVSELDRRGSVVRRAYVVGGEAAVPQEVVSVLRARGLEVVRLSGATRFETAAAVAREIKRVTGMSVFSTVLASGAEANLVDALAASGPAAGELRPILLTEPGKLPSITGQLLRELSASYVMTVGGPAAVSDSVLSEVRALGFRVGRVGGADRYETAAAIASAFYPYLDVRDDVVLASGAQANLVDALSAGALERAVLLTPPTTLAKPTAAWLPQSVGRTLTVVGGTSAVATTVATQADKLLP